MNSIAKLPTPPVFYWFNTYNKKLAVIKPSKQFSTNILLLEGTRKALTGPDLWRWTCLVTTSSFHLGSFPVLLPVFCCLIPYRQTPLSPLPNLSFVFLKSCSQVGSSSPTQAHLTPIISHNFLGCDPGPSATETRYAP